MRKLTIMQACEGMVLAKALTNSDGKVLVAEKGRLTEKILTRLEDWGCDVVFVEGDPQSDEEKGIVVGLDISSGDTEELFAQIDKSFSKVSDDALMIKVRETLKEQLVKKLSPNGN